MAAVSIENSTAHSRRFGFLSYAIVTLLLFKDLWGIWIYKDITSGDTSSYYGSAVTWFTNFVDNLVWSPLYTSFYGTVLIATHDPYGATILHRIVIVICAGLGSLFLLRRILSPGFALAVAVWWCLLPINFNTVYEVHLFSFLPMLCALILASGNCGPVQKGAIIGILLCTTVLVRNETSVVLVIFTLFCGFEEIRDTLANSNRSWQHLLRNMSLYAIPVLISLCIVAFFYWRSSVKFPAIAVDMAEKQKLNACQIYAFGYSQRYSDFVGNAMTDCSSLMQRVFGQAEPTLGQMMAANPIAVMKHFLWNLSLIPSGLELALFNSTGGSTNPDYIPVALDNRYAHGASLAVIVILAIGAWKFWQARQQKASWVYDKRYFLLLAACLTASSLVIALTTRPRPSYLFAFTLCLMTIVGLALEQLMLKRIRAIDWMVGFAGILLVLTKPFYYPTHASPRYVLNTLRAVQPFVDDLRSSEHIVLGDFAFELTSYLEIRAPGVKMGDPGMKIEDYQALEGWDGESSIGNFLLRTGIDAFYSQPRMTATLMRTDGGKLLMNEPAKLGWKEYVLSEDGGYRLFIADKGADLTKLRMQALAEAPKDVVTAKEGVSSDGWMRKDGTITVHTADSTNLVMKGTVPGGIGIQESAVELGIAGQAPVEMPIVPGPFEIAVPVPAGDSTITYRFAEQGRLPNGDDRMVGGHLDSLSFTQVDARSVPSLKQPLVSSTGVSKDGWMAKDGVLSISAPRAETLVVQGIIPAGIGLSMVTLDLGVKGAGHVERTLAVGPFTVELPVDAGLSNVVFRFSQVGVLPNGDGRSVSARMSSVELNDALAAKPSKTPPALLKPISSSANGIYEDGWMEKSGSISLLPNADEFLILNGVVPDGLNLGQQALITSIPGEQDVRTELKIGDFTVPVFVKGGAEQLTFRFEHDAILPNGDGRSVAALLKSAQVRRE